MKKEASTLLLADAVADVRLSQKGLTLILKLFADPLFDPSTLPADGRGVAHRVRRAMELYEAASGRPGAASTTVVEHVIDIGGVTAKSAPTCVRDLLSVIIGLATAPGVVLRRVGDPMPPGIVVGEVWDGRAARRDTVAAVDRAVALRNAANPHTPPVSSTDYYPFLLMGYHDATQKGTQTGGASAIPLYCALGNTDFKYRELDIIATTASATRRRGTKVTPADVTAMHRLHHESLRVALADPLAALARQVADGTAPRVDLPGIGSVIPIVLLLTHGGDAEGLAADAGLAHTVCATCPAGFAQLDKPLPKPPAAGLALRQVAPMRVAHARVALGGSFTAAEAKSLRTMQVRRGPRSLRPLAAPAGCACMPATSPVRAVDPPPPPSLSLLLPSPRLAVRSPRCQRDVAGRQPPRRGRQLALRPRLDARYLPRPGPALPRRVAAGARDEAGALQGGGSAQPRAARRPRRRGAARHVR